MHGRKGARLATPFDSKQWNGAKAQAQATQQGVHPQAASAAWACKPG